MPLAARLRASADFTRARWTGSRVANLRPGAAVLAAALLMATFGAPGAVAQGGSLAVAGLVGGEAHDVAVANGFAYVSEGWTIQVIDVRDVAHPIRVGQVPLEVMALRLAATSGRLFAVHGPRGVAAYDLADPRAPRYLGAAPGSPYTRLVAAADEVAYAIDGPRDQAELVVVDSESAAASPRRAAGCASGAPRARLSLPARPCSLPRRAARTP